MQSVYVILLSLIAGILTGETGISPVWSILPAGSGLGGMLLYSFFSNSPSRRRRLSRYNSIWVALLFSGIGLLADGFNRPSDLPIPTDTPVTLQGRVDNYLSTTKGDKFVLDVTHVMSQSKNDSLSSVSPLPLSFKTLVSSDATDVRPGDLVEIRGMLSDFNSLSGRRKSRIKPEIAYSTFVSGEEIAFRGHTSTLNSKAQHIRQKIEICIDHSPLKSDTKRFIITLLLGDKEYLTAETRDTFSDAGVAHILAVSGMHVGIVTTLVLILLYPLSLIGKYKWRYTVAIPAIWLFVWLTGMQPSTVRAAVMITFYLMALVMERRYSPLKALAWAAIIILIVSPRALFDIGFQLSFLCVGSLIVFVKPLNTVNQRRHPRLYALNALFLITIIASLSSWVVSSYYFHKVTLMFLPANLVAVPLLPLFVGLFLIYFGLWSLGINVGFMASILDSSYSAFCKLVSEVSRYSGPLDNYSVGEPTVWLWVAALIAGAWILNHRRGKIYLFICVVLFAIALVSVPIFKQEDSRLSFIIHNSIPNISLTAYTGEDKSQFNFPKGYITTARIGKESIVGLERGFPSTGLTPEECKALANAVYVILGSGFSGTFEPFDSIIPSTAKIILHSSLSSHRKSLLLSDSTLSSRSPSILPKDTLIQLE